MGLWSFSELDIRFRRKIETLNREDKAALTHWNKSRTRHLLPHERFLELQSSFSSSPSQQLQVTGDLLKHTIGTITQVAVCLSNRGIPLNDLITLGATSISSSLAQKKYDNMGYFLLYIFDQAHYLMRRYIEQHAPLVSLPPDIYKLVRKVKIATNEGQSISKVFDNAKGYENRKADILRIASTRFVSLQDPITNSDTGDVQTFEDIIEHTTIKPSVRGRYLRLILHRLTHPKKELPPHLQKFSLSKTQANVVLLVHGGLLSREQIMAGPAFEEGTPLTQDCIAQAASRGLKKLKGYFEVCPIPTGCRTHRGSKAHSLN
jgi:hypothetical protein